MTAAYIHMFICTYPKLYLTRVLQEKLYVKVLGVELAKKGSPSLAM